MRALDKLRSGSSEATPQYDPRAEKSERERKEIAKRLRLLQLQLDVIRRTVD